MGKTTCRMTGSSNSDQLWEQWIGCAMMLLTGTWVSDLLVAHSVCHPDSFGHLDCSEPESTIGPARDRHWLNPFERPPMIRIHGSRCSARFVLWNWEERDHWKSEIMRLLIVALTCILTPSLTCFGFRRCRNGRRFEEPSCEVFPMAVRHRLFKE